MEIAPVPHRSTRSEWRRFALGLTVVAPVVLLVLLPPVLGLDRFVVTEDGGALARGSVVLARDVPPSDLHAGDVITFRPAGGETGERVTRRVASTTGAPVTEAGATLDGSSYSRVWLAVPYLGYPFVLGGGWVLLALAAVAALALALSTGRGTPPKAVRQTRPRVSVG